MTINELIVKDMVDFKEVGLSNKQIMSNMFMLNERRWGFNNARILSEVIELTLKKSKFAIEIPKQFELQVKYLVSLKKG